MLKAIQDPLYVDALPQFSNKNNAKAAHVIYIGEKEYEFLNVVLSFNKGGRYTAQIWTAFRANRRYLLKMDGKLDARWKKKKIKPAL